jgi:hypothetical protein
LDLFDITVNDMLQDAHTFRSWWCLGGVQNRSR